MEKKEVITQLLNNGGVQYKELTVKNVNTTEEENYTRVSITLTTPVKGMVSTDGATYKEGETKVIFVSLYSITSLLKDDERIAFAVNHILKNPTSIEVILSRAKINLIQETVEAGTEYRNPWSENAKASIFDHKTIISHIIDINVSDFGLSKLDKIADKMLGI